MTDVIGHALRSFAAVFAAPEGASPPQRWELRLLVAILIASAIVRFWGLGAVGLHAPDEDTVASPALHLAEHGEPRFPSGMYYARAIVQTYLIAGSINLFGNSEWAMRLPSAVCGILVVILAYFLGRRFLQPTWNLAFVASVALAPELIMQSQNARMYIFLVACVAGFLLLIFAWERSNRHWLLVAAWAMLVLGMQFQTLMIFCSLMLFYPGLRLADARKLWMAGAAFVLTFAAFFIIEDWVGSFYWNSNPTEIAVAAGVAGATVPRPTIWRPEYNYWVIPAAVLFAALPAWFLARQVIGRRGAVAAGLLAFLGLGAQFLLNYHIAFVLMVAGVVIALRNGLRTILPVWVLGIVSVALCVGHVAWLNWIDIGTRGIVLDAMMGRASVWSFVNYIPVSYGAVALAVTGAVVALWRVARGETIPDLWLFVLLALWGPLFLIGVLAKDPQFRYMTSVLLPLLLAAFGTGQWLFATAQDAARNGQWGKRPGATALLACVLVINPVALAKSVNPGYEIYPDHKGAAEYIRSLRLQDGDILIAEDVITQTYYLGKVDYWLTDVENMLKFSRIVNGEVRDVYTDTRVIGTADQLEFLIQRTDRGDIYIIGSGENFIDGHRVFRGPVVEGILEAQQVLYDGRDGLTKVWKVPAARETSPDQTEQGG